MSLQLRITPSSDESLYSILFRNAVAYNFTHLSVLFPGDSNPYSLYSRNMNYFHNAIWQQALYEQGNMLGVHVDSHILNQFDLILFGKAPTKDQKQRVFASESTKYCIHCLREQYYHRLKWDINFITTCIDHNCFLIDQCPGCSGSITLSRLMQRYCACGHDFIKGEMDCLVPNELMISQTIIQALLVGSLDEVTLENGTVISSEDYFYLFNLMGRLLDYFSGKHPIFAEIPLSINKVNYLISNMMQYNQPRDVTMYSVLSAVIHRLIVDPESSFADVLVTVQEMSAGAGKGFRYKRAALRKLMEFSKSTTYLDVYKNLLKEVNDAYVLKFDICREIEDRKFLSITDTQRLLKISRKEVDRLTHAGFLNQVITGATKLISRESIDAWLYKRSRLLNSYQVSDLVGLSPQRIREMAQSGVLTPFSGHNVDGSFQWLFELKNVNHFLSETFKHRKEKDEKLEWFSFTRFYAKLRPQSISFDKAIELLQVGKFTCAFDKEQLNFKTVYILKSAVNDYLQELANERIASFGYTVSDVALLLGSSSSRVKRLVEIGQLRFTSQFINQWGTVSYYFDPDEIKKFINADKNKKKSLKS
ncbi:TniQ family protein [Paenibacillus sp. Soil724D2]|uniref:TniQ family protein n=1 Tax=Paenibacillus sp. (strain Soil724D2) TaxID=1736392 RepID=UPI0007129894|nr:TniQ family protein [Paenibacillus sp. Soil724D2]KRE48395.1 hypothetical protein ASG85_05170 [Paenibacillus sp. Soil724D2]